MKLYLKSSCSSYLNSTCLPTCSGFQESSIVPVYLHVPAFRRKFTLCSRNIYIFFLKELYISIIVCQIFCNLSKENKVSWDNCDSWEMTTSPQNLSMRSFSPQIWSHNKKLSQDSCETANAKISIVFHFNSKTVLLQSRSQKKPKFPTLSHFSKKFSKPEKIFSNQLLQLQSKAFLGALLLNRVLKKKLEKSPICLFNHLSKDLESFWVPDLPAWWSTQLAWLPDGQPSTVLIPPLDSQTTDRLDLPGVDWLPEV